MQDMKIAVWRTGHPIADTVGRSFFNGIHDRYEAIYNCNEWSKDGRAMLVSENDAHIGYGILRGMDDIFRECDKQNKHWLNVDNGYFNPGHFNGYYRISYKGTQARYDARFPCKEFEGEFEPIKKYDKSKPMLVCPPTNPVIEFFELAGTFFEIPCKNYVIRNKGDNSPINWSDYSAVLTFNSSVGWKAIQQGIPCLSDTTHSVVGSYYNTKSIDELIEKFNTMPRAPLFNFMQSHQFTLEEIEQGKAWPLINYYTSSSVTIQERQ